MIRKATPGDASRLAEILIFAKRTAYRRIFRDDATSFNDMRALELALWFRDDADALEGVYVLDDGIVRGMMRAARREDAVFELLELYVDPFFQRQGYGERLLAAFLKMAREAGARDAVLWVLAENGAARAFYEKHGFAYRGVSELEPGTAVSRVLYGRKV